jgi:phosphate transport system substrate-binding protein
MILRFAALAALILMPLPGWTFGKVALTTLDGNRRIEGELVSITDTYFRIETEHGAVTIDSGDVTCEGPGCPDAVELVAQVAISGPADMVHRLMPPLLENFARRQGLSYRHIFLGDDEVAWELTDGEGGRLLERISGQVSEDRASLKQLASRDADLALGRSDGGSRVDQDVIALDALVPVLSPDNPRAVVTLEQLEDILRGKVTDWSELGDDELPIVVHLARGEETERAMARVFPGLRLRSNVIHDQPASIGAAVADDPGALGLAPLSQIGNTVPLVVSGSCGLASPATLASVKSEDYPLTQPLFLHRNGARQPRIIRDFLAYARSHEAQPVIRAAGFVDQGISRISFDRQAGRLANAVLWAGEDAAQVQEVQRLIVALIDAERLTLTFRFEDGSSELDAQSNSNIRRLADAIGRGEFEGRELVFVGFTDGEGPADGNLRLSKRRAASVLRAVRAFAGETSVVLSDDGFGEILPKACDDTAWGRQVNRRVEVWVRRPQPDR